MTLGTEITLVFIDEDEKNRFIGQLSDGWGGGFVQIDPDDGQEFYQSVRFLVTNNDVY